MVLPAAACKILILLHYALRSLKEVMNLSVNVELVHEDFVFDGLQQTVDTMDTIKTQI